MNKPTLTSPACRVIEVRPGTRLQSIANDKLSGQVSPVWSKLGDHFTSKQCKQLRFSNIGGWRLAGFRCPLLIRFTFFAHSSCQGLISTAEGCSAAAAQQRRRETSINRTAPKPRNMMHAGQEELRGDYRRLCITGCSCQHLLAIART